VGSGGVWKGFEVRLGAAFTCLRNKTSQRLNLRAKVQSIVMHPSCSPPVIGIVTSYLIKFMYVESTVTLSHCTEVWLVCVFRQHFTVAAGVSDEGGVWVL